MICRHSAPAEVAIAASATEDAKGEAIWLPLVVWAIRRSTCGFGQQAARYRGHSRRRSTCRPECAAVIAEGGG